MSVYTKTGDKGDTKVFEKKTGKLTSVPKDSCHIKVIGLIDELNSFLGVVKSFGSDDKDLVKKLETIQGNLFTIDSILAGSNLRFSQEQTRRLEKQIDKWEGILPIQKNFIYYGGSKESSLIFYARAICRRAERALVSFSHHSPFTVHPSLLIYLNRLSDYLFMMGRYENYRNKEKEVYWIMKKK
jgi:cob(I)alamin adenosyltransferase